jgi:A nuclease family of the HNH/ENDO VII superfamily with conserved AHH
MWQLRSAQATETPSLKLDLPDGASARLTSTLTGAPDGTPPGVEIVKDGAVISTMPAPMAQDADGTNVPASYRLDGDTLIVDVAHRDADLHYPILVDPEVHEVWGGGDWDYYGAGPTGNQAGMWSLATNGPGYSPYNATLMGRGLFIGSAPGYYNAGASAQFAWGVPPYVNIMSVWFDGLYHVTQGDHLYFGTWGNGAWTNVNNIYGDDNYNQYTAIPNVAWENAYAILGIWEDQSVQHPITGWAGVRGINIRVGDTRQPGVRLDKLTTSAGQSAVNQSFWLPSSAMLQASVVGGDTGLGLQHVGIMSMSNNWIGTSALHINCNGNRSAPCPLNATFNGSLSLAGMNGPTQLQTAAIDITDNAMLGPSWTIKVDGSNPFIGFGGDAWDHRSDGTLGYNPSLQVFATDNAGGVASSGIKSIVVNLTNPAGTSSTVYSYNNPATRCATDSCSVTPTITLPITSPGTYTLQAYTTDYAGHMVQTDPIPVQIRNDTSWTYGGADHAVNTADDAITVGGLLAGASYQAIWGGLSTADKNYMLTVADDPSFGSWAPRIDTVAPAAPDGIQVSDEDNSAHTAEIVWSEGSDPDVSSGVYGSAVDDSRSAYRYQRSGGSWTAWSDSDEDGLTLSSANVGDVVTVQARDYDRAGNSSGTSSRTLTVPSDAPVAHDSQFQIPVIACIEWCPAIAAGGYGLTRYFWSVNQNHYDWSVSSSSSDVSITPEKDDSQTFEDFLSDSKSSSKRKAFRRRGETVARDRGDSIAGKEAHHVVAAGARVARYAQWVFWKCGVDPNDFDANGVWLNKGYHRRMHTKDYYEAINRLLRKYDPTFGSDPCGQSSGGVDIDGGGLKRDEGHHQLRQERSDAMNDLDWTPPSPPDWSRVSAALGAAVAEALDSVVRWEWQPADAALETPQPFASERVGRSPVRLRGPGWEPKDQTDAVKYGWDDEGRLRVARRFTERFADGVACVVADDRILTYRFDAAGDHLDIQRAPRRNGVDHEEVLTLSRRTMEGDRLIGLTRFWREEPKDGSPLWLREVYELDAAGRVDAVIVQRDLGTDHPDVRFGESQRRVISLRATRDVAGNLISLYRQEFTEHGEAATEPTLEWQLTDAEAVRIAVQFLTEEMPAAIRAWADRAEIDAPAYCLGVLYGESWGPSLGIGTTADLARWGSSGSADRMERMWNPAEFRCFDPEPAELNAEAFAHAYRVSAQTWGADTPARIRKICLDAARALKNQEPPFGTAETFVVFATDLEIADLDANVRKLAQGQARRDVEKLDVEAL